MKYRDKIRHRYMAGIITAIGVFLGLLYPLIAGQIQNPIAILNGLTIGLLGGILVAAFEIFLFTSIKRRYSFTATVLLKTLAYTILFVLLIITVINVNESWYYNMSISENFSSKRFQYFLSEGDFKVIVAYSLFSVLTIIFTREMSRKMGQGVFLNFLFGKYHKPREEHRIFMFLDQKSSTSLAEEMTSLGYFEFLKEFYSDITICILSSGGEIYRYVGDQMVISWTVIKGIANANCIRCYFRIREEIENQREKFVSKYGKLPEFRVSIHVGQVICGEIGTAKSQIVFHGEALYETDRMEKEGSRNNIDILISEDLAKLVSMPVIYELYKVASVPLSDGGIPKNLFSVREVKLTSH